MKTPRGFPGELIRGICGKFLEEPLDILRVKFLFFFSRMFTWRIRGKISVQIFAHIFEIILDGVLTDSPGKVSGGVRGETPGGIFEVMARRVS